MRDDISIGLEMTIPYGRLDLAKLTMVVRNNSKRFFNTHKIILISSIDHSDFMNYILKIDKEYGGDWKMFLEEEVEKIFKGIANREDKIDKFHIIQNKLNDSIIEMKIARDSWRDIKDLE